VDLLGQLVKGEDKFDLWIIRVYVPTQNPSRLSQIMLLNDIQITLKTKYVEMLPVMSHQSAVSSLTH
jgi:hypothetical protein